MAIISQSDIFVQLRWDDKTALLWARCLMTKKGLLVLRSLYKLQNAVPMNSSAPNKSAQLDSGLEVRSRAGKIICKEGERGGINVFFTPSAFPACYYEPLPRVIQFFSNKKIWFIQCVALENTNYYIYVLLNILHHFLRSLSSSLKLDLNQVLFSPILEPHAMHLILHHLFWKKKYICWKVNEQGFSKQVQEQNKREWFLLLHEKHRFSCT